VKEKIESFIKRVSSSVKPIQQPNNNKLSTMPNGTTKLKVEEVKETS
jgi:hypothetical protein